MIGTAERPMMALSAKLISMNRKSMPTTAHARGGIFEDPFVSFISASLPFLHARVSFAELCRASHHPVRSALRVLFSSARAGPRLADRIHEDRYPDGTGVDAEMRGHLQDLNDLRLVDAEP
jgi:hypothetical protein